MFNIKGLWELKTLFYFTMKTMDALKMCILYFLLSFCALNLTACSDDDNDDENGNSGNSHYDISLLYSTWEEVKQESYKNGQIVPDYWRKSKRWTFKSNKSMTLSYSTISRIEEGTYDLKNNQLTLYYDWYGMDEVKTCDILKLTEDSLIWKEPYTDTEYDYQILYLKKLKDN